jgi:uncharacterized protein (TIGR03437 family)
VSATPAGPPEKLDALRLQTAFGQLPLRFEANDGRLDERVKFLARGAQATLFLTAREAVLRLRGTERADVLRIGLVNANRAPLVTGLERLPSSSHYFIGRDASRWRTGVAHFGKARYASVYPGIDMIFYGQGQLLEYDFVVAPGADARRIRMNFAGARAVRVNEQGELVLQLASGEVRQRPPVAYQEVDGERRVIPARYHLYGKNQVGFTLGAYDRRQTLWIDPVLEYSTFLGGDRSDQGLAVAVDGEGNAYVAGLSDSLDFPPPGPIQAVRGASSDAFIAKLNARGTALIYAAFLGGNSTDVANSVALDAAGNVYLGGTTFSTDFPVTINAVQRTAAGNQDSFVTKIDRSGTALVYSTLLGGVNTDTLSGLTADAAGSAYFIGRTDSPGFAGLSNARQGNPVLRSADRGQAWSAAANGLTASAINGLAVDPTNPNTIYAATNYGVFKTTDGGANWRRTAAGGFTFTIAVDPVTPTTVYVGAQFAVFKSVNGGDAYESILLSGSSFPNVLSLLIDPSAPNTLYAGTSAGPFKSTDGGATWGPIFNGMAPPQSTPPRVNRLVFDPSNPMTIYAATSNNLFKTTNGGALWTPANVGLGAPSFFEILSLAVDPSNPNTLYAGVGGFAGALFKSADGGASWRQSGSGISYQFGGDTFLLSVNNIAIDPTAPATLYTTTTSGGLFKSTDGGMNWSLVRGSGLTNRLLTTLAVDRAGLLYAGASVGGDAFLGKLNPDGSALSYFRYYGGSENDEGRGVAVDPLGNAYIIGTTASNDLPTVNALQPNNRGFVDYLISSDAFVAKLNATGSEWVYATYLGGNSTDQGRAIAIDAAGNAYVTGTAASTDFPVVNAVKPIKADFGLDLFVARLNAAGTALDYSTYLGGSGEDVAAGVAVDAMGNAYVAGTTASPDFPVINTLQLPAAISFSRRDLFVSKLSAQGGSLTFSTYVGGTGDEITSGIAVDTARNVYVTGATVSTDFPTLNPLRPATGFSTEAFLFKLAPRADLAVTAAALPNPAQANNRVTYTLTVTNRGPDETGEVTLVDTLPPGLTNVSATTSAGACAGTATITCDLGELAAGASAIVTITATAPAAGPLRNTATVTGNTPDGVTANNSVTQETRISILPSISGRVTLGGAGLPGVTVSLSGGQTATRQTDANGAYQFAELPAGGDYNVTASRMGHALEPGATSFRDLRMDQTANFASIACNFGITPTRQSIAAGGGTGVIMLTAPASACAWTARSNVPWITITGGASGQGNGAVSFTVAPATVPRSGAITIGDRVFAVQQEFAPCAAPVFRLARGVPLAGSPSDLAAGDFNGDGQADLVVFNAPAGAASLLRGDGRGGFGAPERVELGLASQTSLRAALVADFNNDRRDDLVVVGGEVAGPLFVLLGESAGGFGEPRRVNASAQHLYAVAGNFNGDDRLDLLVLNGNSDSLAVLPGNGDGAFGAAITTNTIGSQRLAVVGDFNNDHNEDVVVVASTQTSLLLGDGTGRFGAPRAIMSNLFLNSVVKGDFDRDGKLDLAAARADSSGGVVLLLRGDGAGAFAAPRNFAVGATPESLGAGDFNNDGLPDVALVDDRLGNIAVLLSAPEGGFRAPLYFSAGTIYNGLAAADFNRDGNLDLATPTINGANNAMPAQISMLFGAGSDFIAGRDTLLAQSPTALAVGDFNQDGLQDVAVNEGARIAVRLSRAEGGFNPPAYLNVEAGALEARDINRDGRIDLIARGVDRLTILLGNGRGEFTAGAPITLGQTERAVALEDFNRDGQLDFVALNSGNQPALFLNNGAGGFGAPLSFGVGMNLNQFVAGDFNGDGNPDVLAATEAGCASGAAAVVVFLGDGRGGFGPGVRSYVNAPAGSILTDDFNGDGRTDVVIAGGCSSSGVVALALGAPDGRLTAAPSVTFANGISTATTGDVNSDGRPDLVLLVGDVFSSFSGFSVQVMPGATEGFSAPVNLGPVARALTLATGDVNGDGRADIITGNMTFTTGGTLTVILNDCRAARSLAHASAASFSGTQFAPESIVAAFGANLATTTLTAAELPLPTELGGTTVKVMDSAGVERLAPLHAVTPAQVNYQIPTGLAFGTATVTITSGDGAISTGAILIAPVAPALFAANANGQGVAAALVLRVRSDGAQVYEPVARFDASQNRFVSAPIDLGPESEQVFLVAFGTGLRFRSSLSAVRALIDGVEAPVTFAGAQGDFQGVDQVNVRLPRQLIGRGEVNVSLTADGRAGNTVTINIK